MLINPLEAASEREQEIMNYETVVKTDPTARAQGQQIAREENERKMRELRDEMERDRQQALRDAQELARIEDDAQRRRLDRQRRGREEKERKQKEEERFHELKNELINYDFQTNPRIKKESFRDLEVGDIDVLRIALIGTPGSGRTSFVGTLQRAIGMPQSAFGVGTGKEDTIFLEEYYLQKNILVLDTRAFFQWDERALEECLKLMSGRIRPGEVMCRYYDGSRIIAKEQQQGRGHQESDTPAERALALSKCAHAVIFVLRANNPRLRYGSFDDKLQKFREQLKEDGYAPVTVITNLDQLKHKEDEDEAFDQAIKATGSSSNSTYFIANYAEDAVEQSLEVDRVALDILDSALISAEKFIQIRKQREKNRMEREAMARGAETVKQFFSRLQKKYNWTDQGKMKAVMETLRQQEINTTKVFKELWEDVKSELPLSIGMKIGLEEEMKRL